MEFNLNKVLENLRKKGEALSSFGKEEDDDLIKVKDEEVVKLSDKKDDVSTSTVLEKSGDASEAEEIYQKDQGIITTKDKKKESEEDLEKKLKDIEKVIDTFSGSTNTNVLGSSKELVGRPSDNINLKPLDFSQLQAKANQQEYLKPSNVQNDRIALLYKDLEKYNLI
jgi:uncharacterized FlaG/YvyC family protein